MDDFQECYDRGWRDGVNQQAEAMKAELDAAIRERNEARFAVLEALNDVAAVFERRQPAAIWRMVVKYPWLGELLERTSDEGYLDWCRQEAEVEDERTQRFINALEKCRVEPDVIFDFGGEEKPE